MLVCFYHQQSLFSLCGVKQPACLAQSPQLHKQMAIVGDLKRVFEIGPVFRAEKSMTRFVPAFPMHSVWFYI